MSMLQLQKKATVNQSQKVLWNTNTREYPPHNTQIPLNMKPPSQTGKSDRQNMDTKAPAANTVEELVRKSEESKPVYEPSVSAMAGNTKMYSEYMTETRQQDNALYIYNYLKEEGWSTEAIAGLLGNIQHESGLNPAAWQSMGQSGDGNRNQGYGLVQWTKAGDKFLADCGLTNAQVNDLAAKDPQKLMDLQLEYLLTTMKPGGGEWIASEQTVARHYDAYPLDPKTPRLMSYDDYTTSELNASQLALVFHASYERSGDYKVEETDGRIAKRVNYAENWYDFLTENEKNGEVIGDTKKEEVGSTPAKPKPAQTGDKPTAETQKSTMYVVNVKTNLNLREGASTDSKVIGKAKNQEQVTVIERVGSWYKVEYEGKIGYMSAQYLAGGVNVPDQGEKANIQKGTMYVNASSLNLREKASSKKDSKILATAKNQEQVIVLERSGSWYKVSYNRKVGYMFAKYLSEAEGNTVTSESKPVQGSTGEKMDTPTTTQETADGKTDTSAQTSSTMYVTANSLHFREKPTTDSVSLGTAKRQQEVTIIEFGDIWHKVSYDNKEGYMFAEFLSKTKPENLTGGGSTGNVTIGHASQDENKKASGGKAGDQTGKELYERGWYGEWHNVLRAKQGSVRSAIASACSAACANDNIGYDQNERTTLYTQAKEAGWDLSKIAVKCECDCATLVSVCVNAAGIEVSKDIFTGNMVQALIDTGEFDVYTSADYCKSDKLLKVGDILMYRTGNNGHTVIVTSVKTP